MQTNSRKAGIELLRILAILMVISVHRMGHQTLYSAPQFSISYYVLWFVETASYKAVDIFFIISGYFCITQHLKIKKLLLMEFKVLTYCLGFYFIGVSLAYYSFSGRDFLRAFFPYIGGHYWYYTAYFSLMLLSPWLNKLALSIEKKQLLLLIIIVSGVSTLSIGDAFFTNDGYSVFWACNLYLIGAYIRLHCKRLVNPRKALVCSFACTSFIYLWFVIVGRLTQQLFGKEVFSTHFLVYRQLPVVMGAIFAVVAFVQIDIGGGLSRVIKSVSKCTFGIYLIHSCLFMDTLFWIKLFPANTVSNESWYWAYVIGTIILMFVVCLVIESLRNVIFFKLEQNRIFDRLSEKLEHLVNRIIVVGARIGETDK